MASTNVNARVSPELAARLDAELTRLRDEQPGVGWDRSKVVRVALERYLRQTAAPAQD